MTHSVQCTAAYLNAYFASSAKSETSLKTTSTSTIEDQNTKQKLCVINYTRTNRYNELAIKLQKVLSQKFSFKSKQSQNLLN